MPLEQLFTELNDLANPSKAKDFSWFFKTGPGQYGEGDKFLGITTVPLGKIIKKYYPTLTFPDIEALFDSQFHEHRCIAVSALKHQFAQADPQLQQKIYDFYLAHTARINNWDLVDISAPHIVGVYLLHRDRAILARLAKSSLLWDRRIAIVSTFTFIRQNQYDDTLAISKTLFNDRQDLIHKAVGWMLREVGKRDQSLLENFLSQNIAVIPRTSLRYAIEKFPNDLRLHYLHLDKNVK